MLTPPIRARAECSLMLQKKNMRIHCELLRIGCQLSAKFFFIQFTFISLTLKFPWFSAEFYVFVFDFNPIMMDVPNPLIIRIKSFQQIIAADEDDVTTSGNNIDDAEKRVIFINQPQPQKYCNNHISTAKYRWVTIDNAKALHCKLN